MPVKTFVREIEGDFDAMQMDEEMNTFILDKIVRSMRQSAIGKLLIISFLYIDQPKPLDEREVRK